MDYKEDYRIGSQIGYACEKAINQTLSNAKKVLFAVALASRILYNFDDRNIITSYFPTYFPTINHIHQTSSEVVHALKVQSGVPIFMYHEIRCAPDRYSVCPDSLYEQLSYLHDRGFRAVTLDEYATGNYERLKQGQKPFLLTFDDTPRSQFFLNSNGLPDERSAVGVIEKFRKEKDVRVPAYFYAITKKALFDEKDSELVKLDYLRANDFGIGNHTSKHQNLMNASHSQVLTAFDNADKTLTYLLGSNWGGAHTAAYPYGALPDENVRASIKDELGYILTFHAYGGPAKQPNSAQFDDTAINRYETRLLGNSPGGIEWLLSRFTLAEVTVHGEMATHLY